jgi:hypothetical protein
LGFLNCILNIPERLEVVIIHCVIRVDSVFPKWSAKIDTFLFTTKENGRIVRWIIPSGCVV